MGMVFDHGEIAPRAVRGEDLRERDGSAFFPGLDISSVELLGHFGGGGQDGVQGIDASRLPLFGGSAKEGEGGVFVNTKLNTVEFRSTEMKFGELTNSKRFAEFMVPPASGAASERKGR